MQDHRQPFLLKLRRSRREVMVGTEETMLDALLRLGIDASYTCRNGTCGSCIVRVLSGTADHRDSVLSQAMKESNAFVMPCVSGSRSAVLEIDL